MRLPLRARFRSVMSLRLAHLTRNGAGHFTVEAGGSGHHRGRPAPAAVLPPDPGATGGPEPRLRAAGRRLALQTGSDAGARGRRPRSAWVWAGKRRPRQGPGVCWKCAGGGKCDPSRGGAAHGTRAGGRGGRGALRGSAGGAPGRRGPSGAGRQRGRRVSSRRGRGRTTGRHRTVGRTRGRFSRGGVGPRRRSSRCEIRLDKEPQPWHKEADCLGLSELGAVTRVRGSRPGPHLSTWSAKPATCGCFPLAMRTFPCPAKGRRASRQTPRAHCRVPPVPSGTEVFYSAGSPAFRTTHVSVWRGHRSTVAASRSRRVSRPGLAAAACLTCAWRSSGRRGFPTCDRPGAAEGGSLGGGLPYSLPHSERDRRHFRLRIRQNRVLQHLSVTVLGRFARLPCGSGAARARSRPPRAADPRGPSATRRPR